MNQRQTDVCRIVMDTNVLLPVLTYRTPQDNWLIQACASSRIIPLASEDTIYELREKLLENSPTHRDYQARLFVEQRLRYYRQWYETILPKHESEIPECEDSTDQKFIDLAYAGNAAYLVTRDGKLLAMDSQTPFHILTDADFRRIIDPTA